MGTLRPFNAADMDAVLAIWLAASIHAHDFIEPGYWEEHLDAMREHYLPAAEVWVSEVDGAVTGFCALDGGRLAALFVAPEAQGGGIGSNLATKAQSRRDQLELTVYRRNARAVAFYRRHGFESVREQMDDATGEPELVMRWQRPSPIAPSP